MLHCVSGAQNSTCCCSNDSGSHVFHHLVGKREIPTFLSLHFSNMIVIITDIGFSVKEK